MVLHLKRRLGLLDDGLVKLERSMSIGNVHRARKAARVVRDLAAALDGVRLPELKKETDRLKRALGVVRDLQLEKQPRPSALPPALAQLKAAARRWRKHRPTLELELAGAKSISRKRLARALRHRLARLARRITRLPATAPPRAAHRLRMRIKRAYTIVGSVEGDERQLRVLLGRAAAALGDLHDFDAGLRTRRKSRRPLVVRAGRALVDVAHAIRSTH